MDYYRTLIIGTPGCYRRTLGTMSLARVPRIQVCCPALRQCYTAEGGLGQRLIRPGLGLLQFIPVVTFLAPLASHVEGLKDR